MTLKDLFKNRSLQTISIYLTVSVLAISLVKTFLFPDLFEARHFLSWDAEHYYWIKENGYSGFRIAFFPLFPFIWRVLSLGIYGIVALNGIMFLTSLYLLTKELKPSVSELLLYLSIPSGIFYFLPYTEALFFTTATLVLLGYAKNKTGLIILGLFLCSLSRPSFVFFVPAIIITELYFERLSLRSVTRILTFILTVVAGLIVVFGVHAFYTGNWFAYFEISKGWGGGILQLPKLPFTSWAGGMIVRLDGAALLVGILSGMLALAVLFKAKILNNVIITRELVFSLCYLGGITLFILFRGGNLFSLNRFVFAAPFIIVAFNFWLKLDLQLRTKQLLYIFGLIVAFWFLFNSFVHIQSFLKFLLLSMYVILIFLVKSKSIRIAHTALVIFILLNVVFQLLFYIRFLSGEWVG